MRNRVVVTGYGAICPIGNNKIDIARSWKSAKSGIREVDLFPERRQRIKFAAPVDGFEPEEHFTPSQLMSMGRASQYACVAAREAISDASGLLSAYDRAEVDCYMGVSTGDIKAVEDGFVNLLEKGRRVISPTTIPVAMLNSAAAHVCMENEVFGKSLTIASACASSTQAIGEAFRSVKAGYAKAAIAGGTDASLSWGNWVGWEALNVMDPSGCKPFTANRKGMSLGEGAGVLVLEERGAAIERGASIYAEILGYASNSDGMHITQPSEANIRAVMRKALSDAQVAPGDVGFISAHATGTKRIDVIETNAIKKVFEDEGAPPVSAQKSALGHLMGAAGIVETIIAIQNLVANSIAPTLIKGELDEHCDLDYVPNTPKEIDRPICLKNSFGFGGVNASLVIQR